MQDILTTYLGSIEQSDICIFFSSTLTLIAAFYKIASNKRFKPFFDTILTKVIAIYKPSSEQKIVNFIESNIDIDNILSYYKTDLCNEIVSRISLIIVKPDESNDKYIYFRMVKELSNSNPIIKFYNYRSKAQCDPVLWQKLKRDKVIVLTIDEVPLQSKDIMIIDKSIECIYARVGYVDTCIVLVITSLFKHHTNANIAQTRYMLRQLKAIYFKLKGFTWLD